MEKDKNQEEKGNEKNKENPEEEDEEIHIEVLPEDYSRYDLSFKLIVIGDPFVGKSCLMTKAVKNNYEEYYQATVGFEFLTFNIKLNDRVIKLQIWDTCGQEMYKSLISNFYRNSSLAIVLYAINSKETYDHASSWLSELRSQASPEIRIILVGNKADLEEERQVSKEEGKKFQTDNNLDLFFETSAKNGQNARSVLLEAAKILYKDFLKFENEEGQKETVKGVKVKETKKEDKKKKGCC